MADYLGVDRSALSAELSRMQKDGLIAYKRTISPFSPMNFEVKAVTNTGFVTAFLFLIGSTLTTTISGGTPRRMGITDRPWPVDTVASIFPKA